MNKPDKELVKTPVEELCGDPGKRSATSAAASSVYGLPAPDGVSAGLGADPVLIYTDINPHTEADKPSDAKRFKGVSDEV